MNYGYRQIFAQKLFMRHVLASMINRFGDSIDAIACTWLMFSITNSPSWSAVILGVNLLPNVVIQPFAGAIVERLYKKRIMIIGDIARCLLTVGVLMLYIWNQLSPWMLLLITFLNNVFESFRNPASTSFVPFILEETYYEVGISFHQSISRIVELIGSGLAGVIIASLGMQGAFVIDIITFLLSALLLCTIPTKEQIEHHALILLDRIHICLNDMKDGFIYLWNKKMLLFIAMIACILNMSLVPLNSFQVPYISGILNAPVYVLSAMSMSITVGISIGSFVYPYTRKYMDNRMLLLTGGILLGFYYLSLNLVAQLSSLYFIIASLVVLNMILGLSIGVMSTMSNVLFMKHVDREYIARASAMQGAIATFGVPLLSFSISIITNATGVLTIFFFFGVFTITIFVGMMFLRILKDI